MNKLLILTADAANYETLIRAGNLRQLEIRSAIDVPLATDMVESCNIILGEPSMVSEVLAISRQLEWVQSSWAGIDHLCHPGLRKDYVLTGVKDIFGPLVSEYVMTYLFALERQVFTMRSNQLKQHWQPLPYRPARKIRLGIVGLGSIGQHLATTAKHFGLRVTGLNRSGRPTENVEKVYTANNAATFFAELDYIVLTLPDTPGTRHFINADLLDLMKPSAVLMNVGRGAIINEPDLVEALVDEKIGGAVLDVFTNEPLPRDNPLWQMSNVFVTPHNAATGFAEDIVGIFVENYRRFISQKSLQYVVDFDLGY